MRKYTDTVLDTAGNALNLATVTVVAYPGNGAVTIYSDDGTTVVSGSVVSTNTLGEFSFYAPPARYNLQVRVAGALVNTVTDVQIDEGISEEVATIAAMKALKGMTDGQICEVTSYYASAIPDGGGGRFKWDSTSSAADNGGTIIAPDAGGTGRWRRVYGKSVTPQMFGSVPGQTNTIITTKMQAAIDFCSANSVRLEVPAATYTLLPATTIADEAGTGAKTALTLKSNLDILAHAGATFKIQDSVSTDAAVQEIYMFASNQVLSKITIRGLTMDMNGANNKISPSRPTTYNTHNMSHFAITGTPGGVAARADDVLLENNIFKNTSGVACIVAGQSNTVGVTLGKRWTIKNNLFLNNGTDSSDHTSIFGWTEHMLIDGNVFWSDTPPNTVGKTGASTAHEVHGQNHRVVNNQIINYRLGLYVASNFTTAVTTTVVANNNFYCTNYGVLLFRQQTPASAAVDGVLIEGNTFYFDNYTYSGQPIYRAAVAFQGQIATQQLAINNVKISNNYATVVGTSLFSHFVRWDTVTTVASQLSSNLSITDNQAIGFTHGVYLLTNAANGQGYTEISRNQFINLTADSLGNQPIGVRVNATGTVKTLVMDNNQFIDERGTPDFDNGVYLDSGTITDFYYGPQIFKGLTAAEYTETGSIVVTNWRSPSRQGVSTITYSASMTPDQSASEQQVITATNNTAFTINAPIRPILGQTITIMIRNASGGALGAVTWNANYAMSAWTQPATGFSRSITFRYDGTFWVQISQTGVDIVN